MKVTFCAYDGHNIINGVNAWLRRLLPELKNRGIEIQVLFITWASPQDCVTLPYLRKLGIDCREIPLPYYTDRQIGWILKTLAADRPDVFVPGNMLPGFYASRWLREAGIPTIGVLHNDDLESEAILNEFVIGETDYQLSGILCVSKLLESKALRLLPKRTLVKRIPYGAPVPQQIASVPREKLKLVYVGRLAQEQKRIIETTHALCRAVREIPDTEAVIYGSGPEEKTVKHILQEEGQDLPIYLAGRVDSQQIQEHLLKCHVLVLLSDYEGLPVALMEAMACGLVPICLRIDSGIPELVKDNVTGLLVSDRHDSFIAAVRSLKEDSELWQRLSVGARKKIETEYSHSVCAEQWETLLLELHQSSNKCSVIQTPSKVNLPPTNPAWGKQDRREPPIFLKAYRKSRQLTSRFKKQVFDSIKI